MFSCAQEMVWTRKEAALLKFIGQCETDVDVQKFRSKFGMEAEPLARVIAWAIENDGGILFLLPYLKQAAYCSTPPVSKHIFITCCSQTTRPMHAV